MCRAEVASRTGGKIGKGRGALLGSLPPRRATPCASSGGRRCSTALGSMNPSPSCRRERRPRGERKNAVRLGIREIPQGGGPAGRAVVVALGVGGRGRRNGGIPRGGRRADGPWRRGPRSSAPTVIWDLGDDFRHSEEGLRVAQRTNCRPFGDLNDASQAGTPCKTCSGHHGRRTSPPGARDRRRSQRA